MWVPSAVTSLFLSPGVLAPLYSALTAEEAEPSAQSFEGRVGGSGRSSLRHQQTNQAFRGMRGKHDGQFPLFPVSCATGAILRALREGGGTGITGHTRRPAMGIGWFLGHLSRVFRETVVSAIFQAQPYSPVTIKTVTGNGMGTEVWGMGQSGEERKSNAGRACIKLAIVCEPEQGRRFLLLSG